MLRFSRVLLRVLLAAVVLLASPSARAAGTEPFVFTPPPAWADLLTSRTTAIPLDTLANIRGGTYAAFYADLAPMGGITDTFNVVIKDESLLIDDDFLAHYEDEFRKEVARSWPMKIPAPSELSVLEKAIVTVSGAKCARFVVGASTNGFDVRSLQYIMPSETKIAILTYTTSTNRFDAMLDTFEASAQATQGLQDPPRWRTYPLWARWGAMGAAGGFVIGLLALLKRRLLGS